VSGCPGWQSVNPLCRVGQVVGSGAKSVANDIFSSIAHHFANAASACVSWLWQQLDQATAVNLSSPGIKSDLLATGSIAALVSFALFLIQVLAAAVRQQPGALITAVRGLGVAFLGAAFAVASTQVLLAAVDALSRGVVAYALGTNLRGVGTKLVVAHTLMSIGNPAGLLLLSLVLIASVVVVWVAFMIRKMLIIVSAVFAPIAFSGAASDISRSWVRKWIEFTAALVFSKLVLVIIFMIGLSVLNGAGQAPGDHATASITSLVIGALTLLLAGFAPWIAIKLVHFAGDSFHAVHAQGAGATTGARSAVSLPQKVLTRAQASAAMVGIGRPTRSSATANSPKRPGADPPKRQSSATVASRPERSAPNPPPPGRTPATPAPPFGPSGSTPDPQAPELGRLPQPSKKE
jgi:hypothetical protein